MKQKDKLEAQMNTLKQEDKEKHEDLKRLEESIHKCNRYANEVRAEKEMIEAENHQLELEIKENKKSKKFYDKKNTQFKRKIDE